MTDPVVLERLLQDEEYWTRYREQLRETFLRDMKPIFLAGAIAGEKQAKRVGIARKHLSGKHDQQSHAPNKSGVTAVSLSDEQRQNTSEWMTANGISASSLDSSAEATFARATPAQIAAGKVWYDDAHQFAQDLSSDYGITLEQSAAVLAVISPQMSWERNLEGAKRIIEMHKGEFHLTQAEIDGAYENTVSYASKQGKRGQEIIAVSARYRDEAMQHVGKKGADIPAHIAARYTKSGALNANAEKAFRILRGEDPTKVVYEGKGGFKVKSFYDNILDPKGSREVTVDTHIINALIGGGKSPGAKTTAAVFKHPARYELVADSVRRLADTHDMRPHEMQAILWVVQRPTDAYKTLDEETAFVVDLIWQGFSVAEAELIARNYDEYAVTMKALAFKHPGHSPQSVHGRRGVGFQRKQDLIKNGGFTYQPVSGTSPKKGLALSVYPDREKIFERMPTASEVKSYIKDNADLLKDKRNHIGGWHDTETGRVYLDVSLVVDSRKEAEKLSREYKQEAYFDLESFETVYTRAREDSDKSRAATLSRDDGTIDAGIDRRGDRGVLARALERLKHLGPKHDQSTHGRGGKKPATQLEMDLGIPRRITSAPIGAGFGDTFSDPADFIAKAEKGHILEMYGLDDGEHVVLINNRDPDDHMDISVSGPGISLQRQFYPDGRVHHDYFKVTGEKQSEGTAARINARAEEYYMSAGFNRIDLNADIDVGKYAWAKQGYDFEDELHREWSMERAEELSGSSLFNYDTPRKDRPRAWEIAALDDGELYEWSTTSKSGTGHLGKAAMLSGSDWDGIKRLDRDDEGFKVGRAYYASKGIR